MPTECQNGTQHVYKTASIEIKRRNQCYCCRSPPRTTVHYPNPFKNIKPEKLFTPEFSANKLIQVMHSLSINDSGKYLFGTANKLPKDLSFLKFVEQQAS